MSGRSGDSFRKPGLSPGQPTDQALRLFAAHELEVRVHLQPLDGVQELLVHHGLPQVPVQVSQALEERPQLDQVLLDFRFDLLESYFLLKALRGRGQLAEGRVLVGGVLAALRLAIRVQPRGLPVLLG